MTDPVGKRELEPDPDTGVTIVTLGTLVWIIATFIMLLYREQLLADGRGTWIWIGIAGTGLGFLGQIYTRRRAARIARGAKY